MSNLKRFLAMMLVMVMMVSSLAMSASAKFFDDVDALKDADLIAAVDLLSEFGIAKGTGDGSTFDPESPVTRQQFALFVARIHSATPEYFVPSDSKDDIPQFADIIDKTYFTAINYCYQNKIINGLKEPVDGANGEFAPENGIIFQDAVKMLVSALGYASATEDSKGGLAYPVGYLAKAKEIGLLDGFGLDKIKAGEEITRANMAGLLYNYFLSDYIEVQLYWNPVKTQYESSTIKTPVCNKFGVTKIEGYVTAIEGAAIPLTVEDTLSTEYGKTVKFDVEPISRKMADPKTTGYYDIVISYLTNEFEKNIVANYVPVYDSKIATANNQIGWIEAGGTTTELRKLANFSTTKAALGLDKDYADLAGSRELLGCKVVAFANTTNKVLKLPTTRVLGEKTRVEKPEVDVTWNHEDNDTGRVNRVNSLTFGDVKFNQRQPADLNPQNAYVFAGGIAIGVNANKALPINDSISPSESASALNLNYLAGMIKRGGAITVDLVDNGMNLDGTPNYVVIFTPFEAVYVNKDNEKITTKEDAWEITFGTGHTLKLYKSDSLVKYVDATTFTEKKIEKDNAYLISRQGEYVINYAKLELLAEGTVSAIDDNSVNITRTTGYGYVYADLIVRYNYRNVFYQALNNRLQGTIAPNTAYTATGVGSPNNYTIAQNDKYKVFAPSSASPNYGYWGEDSRAFFIYKTGDTGAIDTSKHYGYILSNAAAPQSMAGGSMVTPYTVYDLNTRTQVQVLDANSTIRTYDRGTHIIFYAQGNGTHTITSTVNPFALNGTGTTNVLTVVGAREALEDLIADFGTTANTFGNGKDDSVLAKLFYAQLTDIRAGLKENVKSLEDIDVRWAEKGTTRFAIGGNSAVGFTAQSEAAVAYVVGDQINADGADSTKDKVVRAADAGIGVVQASFALYNAFSEDDIEGIINMAAGFITILNSRDTTQIPSLLQAAYSRLKVAVDAAYIALDTQLELVKDAEANGKWADTAAQQKGNTLILALCEAYVAAIEGMLEYVEESVYPAVENVFFALGVSDGDATPAGTLNLAGTNFLGLNEAGWTTTNERFGIRDYEGPDIFDYAFDGFWYNTATKEVWVGRPGADIDVLDTTNNVVTDNYVRAGVNTSTKIFIYDIDDKSNVNMISRDELDALMRIGFEDENFVNVYSALLVREDFLTGANNGTASVLYLGLDGDNPTANAYLNRVNNTTTYLTVASVSSTKVLIDNVWYFIGTAQDSVNSAISNVLISAPSYYTSIATGSSVYLTSSYVTYNGTNYRVAQLTSYNSDINSKLTTSGIQSIVSNSAYRVVSGSYIAGSSVTTGTTYYYLNGTSNIAFVRLSLEVNSAGTITKITKLDDDLKVVSTPSFDSKSYNSSTFSNKMTQPITSVSNTGYEGWYVVPVDSYAVNGGVVAFYINDVTVK